MSKTARNAEKAKPQAEPMTEKNDSNGQRAKRFPEFKKLYHVLNPFLEGEISKSHAALKGLDEEWNGTTAIHRGAVVAYDEDGDRHQLAAITREQNERLNSAHTDSARDKELKKQKEEILTRHANRQKLSREVRLGLNNWTKLLENSQKLIRDGGNTRVVKVPTPKGVGDGRKFGSLLSDDDKVAKEIEDTNEAPVDLEEQDSKLLVAVDEIVKVGLRSINLDNIAEPYGNGKIVFTGKTVRDSVTGNFIELPASSEMMVAMRKENFIEICRHKLRGYDERNGGEGITSAERKKRIAALWRKRFDLHLKIVGEFQACREKGIPVVLPGNLNLFSYLGLRPVRDRDLEARERPIHLRDD